MITTRTINPDEIDRISEIDRSEEISQEYVRRDGELQLRDAHWSVTRWKEEGSGEHSVASKIAAWRPLLEAGTAFAAFDGEKLVGVAIYHPDLSPGMAQFAVLHVSRPYRRRGLGAALAARVIEAARRDAARQLYVSSSPSRATVEFYQSLGFAPTAHPNRELLELEPEDIHMTMDL
jgi:GNAT superfamily N-acetyltransferase